MDSEGSRGIKRNRLGDNAKDWFPEGEDWAAKITELQKPLEDLYEASWLIKDWSRVSQSEENLIFQFEGGPLTKHTWELHLDIKDEEQLKLSLKLKGNAGTAQFVEFRTFLNLFTDGPTSRNRPMPFASKNNNVILSQGQSILWDQMWPTRVEDDTFRIHVRLLIKITSDGMKHTLRTSQSLPALPPSGEALAEYFGSLFQVTNFADFVLVVGDVEIPAHKVILARSPVFAAMFATQMTENVEGRVMIEDFQPEVVKALLKFIYTGKAEVKDVSTGDLLLIAEKYELPELVAQCEWVLISELDIPNAAQLLKLGHLVASAGELKNRAIEFIKWNLDEVSKTEGYQVLAKTCPELLSEILLWKK